MDDFERVPSRRPADLKLSISVIKAKLPQITPLKIVSSTSSIIIHIPETESPSEAEAWSFHLYGLDNVSQAYPNRHLARLQRCPCSFAYTLCSNDGLDKSRLWRYEIIISARSNGSFISFKRLFWRTVEPGTWVPGGNSGYGAV